MRGFFKSRVTMIIAAIITIIVVLGVASLFLGGRAGPVSDLTGVLFSPIQRALSSLGSGIGDAFTYTFKGRTLLSENEALKEKVSELEEKLRNAEYYKLENEQLRGLLDLKEKSGDFDFASTEITATAEIIAWSNSNWGAVFTIDKGEMDGVELNQCVITKSGFAGYVTKLYTAQAEVTSVIDTNMEAGAMLSRTRQAAVAEGDFNLMKDGCFKLSYLPKDSDILVGDTVQTSGTGGLFPKGIVMGTVLKIETEAHGVSNYAIIKPAVDIDSMGIVFIIKKSSAAAG